MFEDREDVPPVPPCLILAHSDLSFAAAIGQALRRLGWDVYLTRRGAEARRLAGMLSPRLIVLGTELPDESGWLACDKLTSVLPHTRVLLLADTLEPRSERFAAFVGAEALVSRGSFPRPCPCPVTGSPRYGSRWEASVSVPFQFHEEDLTWVVSRRRCSQ